MRGRTTNEEESALYLMVDVPCLYQEAMSRPDADKWVAVIAEEFNNLQQKDVFVEVENPMDVHVHEGHLVFDLLRRSDLRET